MIDCNNTDSIVLSDGQFRGYAFISPVSYLLYLCIELPIVCQWAILYINTKECLLRPGDWGSIQGRVISMPQKIVLDASLPLSYLPTPPLEQDVTQGQFLSEV